MTTYPAKIDNSGTLPISVDNSTPIKADVTNRLRGAILAIEQELGVKPAGIYATVKARLENIENTLDGSNFVELDGDLGGTTTDPIVIGLRGLPVSTVTPSLAQVLTWNGLSWEAADGAIDIASTLPWKSSVRVVAVVNLTTSGLQTVDGESLIAGDRILLTAQTDPIDNGIYVVASGAWSRSADMLDTENLELGTFVKIMEGTTYGNSLFELTSPTDGAVIIGTTALTWTEFSATTAAIDTLTGDLITIENTIGTDYLNIVQSTSDIVFRVLDSANSFTLGWTQETSGAGKATTIVGQQGQAGNIGGSVTIRSGRGGTGGTNAGGTIVLDLAQQVSGNTDYLYISENNTPFLGLRRSTTTANFVVQGTTTDVGWAQDNFIFNTTAGSTKLTGAIANAFTWTYDSAITGIIDSITKRTGTGANVGASRTIAAQDGQNVAAGTNNNGGDLTLKTGAVGTGGSAGAHGSIKMRANSTDFLSFTLSQAGIATITGGDVTSIANTWQNIASVYTVSRATTGYLDHDTLNLRTAAQTQKCSITISDTFVENFASGVTADRQINSVSRILTTSTGNTFGGAVRYDSDISPTSISSNQTDYNPTGWSTSTRIRQAVGTSCIINSAAAGSDGERKVIENISTTNYLTLLHDDGATGTAAQRFLCLNAVSTVIPPLGSVTIEYDGTSSRWRVISVAAGTNLSGADYVYAASVTVDFTVNNIARIGALTGGITMNAPTGGISGPLYVVSMLQDGTGGRAVTWNAAFVFSEGYEMICPTASALTTWVFVYNPGTTNFRCISRAYDLGNNGIVSFSSGSPTLVPGKINILSGTVTNPVIPAGSGWGGGFNAITVKLNNLTGGTTLQRSGSDTLNGGTTYVISEVYGQAVLISTGTTDILVSPGLS